MNDITKAPVQNYDHYELRVVTKAVSFLAALTGLLYLRVIIGEVTTAVQQDDFPVGGVLMLILLIVATAGLIISWWWEGLGGWLAVIGGIGLAFVDYSIMDRGVWLVTILYCTPFIIAGTCCLVCAYMTKTK
jgi:hypothetical protein